ncbi:germin-like protein subfamily 3 member 3 [Silene latifolia]|uniref:germin-like protein subfamily 3 member 3 n=1 Tax=Silene latifolia TaxID=37657 RepID=UPI003D76A611
MNNLAFFITCSLMASISHAIVSDFCVGDINLPMGPSGYACKNPSNVTLDDFIFTGFRVGGPTNNGFKNNVHLAFADAYPGLNGLEVGDVMIFPQGLLHFQVNVGKGPALAFVSLNSANPGLQVTSTALFAGNLPAEIVEKTTLIDHSQVIKLRKMFGNSN